jgi:hypothetical protein
MHNTKTYAVIDLTDLELIDFSQIDETTESTTRKSIDITEFVIKWQEGKEPIFITDGSVIPVEKYDHHAILELMATDKWSLPMPI